MVWNSRKPWNGWNKWKRRPALKKAATIPASRIPRSIARVRSEWVTLFNPPGSPDCPWVSAPYAPQSESCRSSFAFTIVDPTTLTDVYQDDVKVSHISGFIYMKPVFQRPNTCDMTEVLAWQNRVQDYFIMMRGGLYKQYTTEAAPDGLFPHPFTDEDYSDTRYLQRYSREWVSKPYESTMAHYGSGSFYGLCANTTRNSYLTPATSTGSQPAFSVPEIETACAPAFAGSEDCWKGPPEIHFREPAWKKIRVSHRKDIRLRENDRLDMFFDWGPMSLQPMGDCGVPEQYSPCAMHILPVIKLRIQYG